MSEKEYLVFTADETTWPKDKKILFAGRWCLLQERENFWSKLNYNILKPIPVNKESLYQDFEKSEKIYEDILVFL